MIYNVARVRKLFAKVQVDTCKTKKDTSTHAQFIMCKTQEGYLQNFKSIHTKLKEIDLRMRSCVPCN